jgi:hypothetical protein
LLLKNGWKSFPCPMTCCLHAFTSLSSISYTSLSSFTAISLHKYVVLTQTPIPSLDPSTGFEHLPPLFSFSSHPPDFRSQISVSEKLSWTCPHPFQTFPLLYILVDQTSFPSVAWFQTWIKHLLVDLINPLCWTNQWIFQCKVTFILNFSLQVAYIQPSCWNLGSLKYKWSDSSRIIS